VQHIPVGLYLQLAAILRAQIESGELPPDRPLPSYTTLMQEHGIAGGTSRALDMMVEAYFTDRAVA